MKKCLYLLLTLSLFSLLLAQENTEKQNDSWSKLVGEWEGTTTSPIGTAKDHVRIGWGIGDQFFLTHIESKLVEVDEGMVKGISDQYKVPLEQAKAILMKPFHGMMVMRINPQTKAKEGHFYDSYRGMYDVTETIGEDGKITITANGPVKIVRTFEFVGEDKIIGTFKNTEASGQIIEGNYELVRKR